MISEKMISFIKKLIMNRISMLKLFRKFDEVRFFVFKNQQGLFLPKSNIFRMLLLLFSFVFAFDRLFGVFLKRKQILKKKTIHFTDTQKKNQSTMEKKCWVFGGKLYFERTFLTLCRNRKGEKRVPFFFFISLAWGPNPPKQ